MVDIASSGNAKTILFLEDEKTPFGTGEFHCAIDQEVEQLFLRTLAIECFVYLLKRKKEIFSQRRINMKSSLRIY